MKDVTRNKSSALSNRFPNEKRFATNFCAWRGVVRAGAHHGRGSTLDLGAETDEDHSLQGSKLRLLQELDSAPCQTRLYRRRQGHPGDDGSKAHSRRSRAADSLPHRRDKRLFDRGTRARRRYREAAPAKAEGGGAGSPRHADGLAWNGRWPASALPGSVLRQERQDQGLRKLLTGPNSQAGAKPLRVAGCVYIHSSCIISQFSRDSPSASREGNHPGCRQWFAAPCAQTRRRFSSLWLSTQRRD